MDWLNGPLVWAIDAWHQPMYLFPRGCPRILYWPLATTTAEDRRAYTATTACRMVACIEAGWLERLVRTVLHRYALPAESFECLDDAGMWVARDAVSPDGVTAIDDLAAALSAADVELRVVPSLEPLKALWRTSLHVSGIRLRNMRTAWSRAASPADVSA
jgi:hypothetical protein